MDWMLGLGPPPAFFGIIAVTLITFTDPCNQNSPKVAAPAGYTGDETTRGDRRCSSRFWARLYSIWLGSGCSVHPQWGHGCHGLSCHRGFPAV